MEVLRRGEIIECYKGGGLETQIFKQLMIIAILDGLD